MTNGDDEKKYRVDEEEKIPWLRKDKMHQENILYTRLNIFILVMSIMFATAVMVWDKNKCISQIICWFGLLVTILWLIIILRQWQVVNDIRDMLEWSDKYVYQKIRGLREKRDGEKIFRKMSGQKLIFFMFPWIFIIFWIIMLLFSHDLLKYS